MSKQDVAIFQHTDHPEWGRGVVLALEGGRADRLDISFETGGRRTILKSYSAKLRPVTMSAEDARLLGEKLANRRSASASRSPTKKSKAALGVPAFATFDAQRAQFEAAFPGGFRGEKFEREVRGLPGAKRKKTDTGPALADAAEALSAKALAERDPAAIFDSVTALVRTTSFVHPLEGANLLGTMKPEHRPEFVEALKELLHGTHDASDRFDRFVSAIRFEDAKGAPKRPSWPLATLFAALVHPTVHVCVKPTFFQKQAALVAVPLDYQPTPASHVYTQLLAVVRKTQDALRAAGQDPRDLVDVASFICLTHGAKTEAKV